MKNNNMDKDKPGPLIEKVKQIAKKMNNKAVIILILGVVMLNIAIFAPIPTLAKIKNIDYFAKIGDIDQLLVETKKLEKKEFKNKLPKNSDNPVAYARNVVFTAYNSEVGQCDSTPCITANGFNVCEHGIEDTIAMNGVRMGTKVRIPELYGDRVFVVRDRMNSRYGADRADIWMISKQEAKQFGVKLALVEFLK